MLDSPSGPAWNYSMFSLDAAADLAALKQRGGKIVQDTAHWLGAVIQRLPTRQ